MVEGRDNPMGLDGFEFVEFTSSEPEKMAALIEQLGFTDYAKHPTKDVVRYKQGDINLLLNRETTGQAAAFRAEHGPSTKGMAFRTHDPEPAYALAIERGAKPADAARGALYEVADVRKGIGGSLL